MKLAGHPATEAKHMNNWLNRLERKYGRYGIPNLTNILVAGQILVLAIELFVDRTISFWLGLSRSLLLQGQIWPKLAEDWLEKIIDYKGETR